MNRLTVLMMGCLLLASCFSGKHEPTEAELSAFGTYVNSLDSTLEGKWFTRMGVSEDADSVLSYLRRELPRNGLDSTAFFIPQIAEDLDVVHRLARLTSNIPQASATASCALIRCSIVCR